MSAKTCMFVRQEEECHKCLPLFVFEALFLSPAAGPHPKEPQSTATAPWAPSAAALGRLSVCNAKKINKLKSGRELIGVDKRVEAKEV